MDDHFTFTRRVKLSEDDLRDILGDRYPKDVLPSQIATFDARGDHLLLYGSTYTGTVTNEVSFQTFTRLLRKEEIIDQCERVVGVGRREGDAVVLVDTGEMDDFKRRREWIEEIKSWIPQKKTVLIACGILIYVVGLLVMLSVVAG